MKKTEKGIHADAVEHGWIQLYIILYTLVRYCTGTGGVGELDSYLHLFVAWVGRQSHIFEFQ